MKKLLLLCIVLAGCSAQVQMMPRDSGKIYTGQVTGSGLGAANMTITIEGETYAGKVVRTASNDNFGLIQQFGRNGSSFSTVVTSNGSANLKAILSSQNSRGLRCDLISNGNNGGGGVCIDDQSRIFDVIVTR